MKYIKKLVGNKCYLAPISLEDAELVAKWSNDLNVSLNTGDISSLISVEQQREYLKNMISRDNSALVIVALDSDKPIGIVRLMEVDHVNRKANFGIFIGEIEYHSKGIGTEAAQLMIDYGFNVLNLNNIMLIVYSFNQAAIKSYLKIGFNEIGRRRSSIVYGDYQFDEIYMDIVSDEFSSPFIVPTLLKKGDI